MDIWYLDLGDLFLFYRKESAGPTPKYILIQNVKKSQVKKSEDIVNFHSTSAFNLK